MKGVRRLGAVLWLPNMRICRGVGWAAAVVGRLAEDRVGWTAHWFAMALWEEVEVVDVGEVGDEVLSEYHAVGDSEVYYVSHLECYDARWECLVKDDSPVVVDVDERDQILGMIWGGRRMLVLYLAVFVGVVLRDTSCSWAQSKMQVPLRVHRIRRA